MRPLLRRAARRLGYHLVRANAYSPIPDVDALPAAIWDAAAPMPGVDLRLEAGLALLEGDLAPFVAEYAPPAGPPGTAHGYYLGNPMYGGLDAEVLYAMVRRLRPARIVEVGAGWSSLVIADAAARNAAEGAPVEHRVYDPQPSPLLANLDAGAVVTACPAQAIPAGAFAALQDGDVLFVDTTHAVKPGGDVVRLALEVVPALAPGVVVHVHDFFRPFEYPRELVEHWGAYWQEHYLLQAFLAFNDDFEVLLANHALARLHHERVRVIVPSLEAAMMPSALWLQRKVTSPAAADGTMGH
jgi:Methyltransferase domain